jgi:hypothetical protein
LFWSRSGSRILQSKAKPFQFFLHFLDGISDLRKSPESHQLASRLSHRTSRRTKISLPAWHVTMNPGLGSDDRTVTKMHVVGNTNLPRADHKIACRYGAS